MFSKRTFRRQNKPKQSSWIESNDSSKDSPFVPPIQTKLNIGKPGDVFEKEADRTADQVVSDTSESPNVQKTGEEKEEVQAKGLAGNIIPFVQKQEEPKEEVQAKEEEEVQAKCDDCAEEEKVQKQEEEEEPVQAKEEEEEPVQAKEEEEPVQAKEKEESVKAQEEEEPIQAQEEEEEPVQAKEEEESVQAQQEEEPVQAQEEEEPIQAQEEEEEPVQAQEEEEVQQKSNVQSNPKRSVERKLSTHRGGGHTMDTGTRMSMESSFNNDFSNVKIHTGGYAQEMNKDLRARAFTNGNDIYFNSGEYNPKSKEGKHLLAHELTHTIQQKGARNMINKTPQPNPHNLCTPGEVMNRASTVLWFNHNATTLRNDSQINSSIHLIRLINEVKKYARVAGPNGRIFVHGYASEEGGASHNQTLSTNRAIAIKNLLVQAGVNGSMLVPVGHGENNEMPTREFNRRAEVTYRPPATCPPCQLVPLAARRLMGARPVNYGRGPDSLFLDFPALSTSEWLRVAPFRVMSNNLLAFGMNNVLGALGGSDGRAMVTHFRGGSGATWTHGLGSRLNREATFSGSVNTAIGNLETQLRTQIAAMIGTGIVDPATLSVTAPTFHFQFSDSNALKGIIGGTQGLEVYLQAIRMIGNSCHFQFDIQLVVFDDFGVDTTDLYWPALIKFWILQHERAGNRPFINRLLINRTITI